MTKRRYFSPLRCYFCGRFMSYADMAIAVVWTPYGSYGDLEPPENEWAHRHCWDGADEGHKGLIRKSWHAPFFHGAPAGMEIPA